MTKNKKIIIFIAILVFLVGLILLLVQKDKDKEVSQIADETISSNKTGNTRNEYDEKINELSKIETNSNQEETIITIIDKEAKPEENTINITSKDIEYIKILDTTKGDINEKVIESKIYAREAVKIGITLSQDALEEIDSLSSSDEILSYIQNDEVAKKNFKEGIATYLTEIEYEKELKNRIADEIHNNSISIQNEDINNKMQEYISINNKFKEIENPTEEDKKSYLAKIANMYFEIQKLYLDAIKDKYVIKT